MDPQEFLRTIVRPNVNDFQVEYGDLRRAYNAVAAVDALAAHVYEWCKDNKPHEVAAAKRDTDYRANLANRDQNFRLLRDVAKAQKHARLVDGAPLLRKSEQVSSRSIAYGEGTYGRGRYGGPKQIIVDLGNGKCAYLEKIVNAALNFLESEMLKLGI